MKYYINYNKQFDTLMGTFLNDKVHSTTKKDNIIILKNINNDIVGINILNVSNEIKIEKSFCSGDEKIINYFENKIKNFYNVKQESQFIIGKIIECTDIENTHLRKCIVDIASEKLQIICGAPNARTGLYVVAATVNSIMPNYQIIEDKKLKGVQSSGMICSSRELGIDNDHSGIIELSKTYETKLGLDFWKEYYNNDNKL